MDPFDLIDKSINHRGPLFLMVATILTFFLWAGFTEIDQHVRATGRIVPSGKVRMVQHLEGGIVSEILAHEGQEVEEGTPLLSIVNRRAEADLKEGTISQDYLLIKRARLEAEIADKSEPVFDSRLREAYPDIVASETNLFASRRQEFQQKTEGLQEKINQKSLRLEELTSTSDNLRQEAAVARKQMVIKKNLYQHGAISQSQYLDAQSTVQDFITRIQKNETEKPIVQAELGEATNNLAEMEQIHASELSQSLNDVNVDIKRQEERIGATSDQVQRTAIVSPIRGVVNKINVNTIGGIVKAGEDVVEILPIGETLVVEGRMDVNDRGKVWMGLPVVAKVMAYEYAVYGGIDGTLTYISADSFIDGRNQEFYQIKISLDADNLGQDRPVHPGMIVELNIIGGKVSVLHALLKPLMRIGDAALREP